MNRIYRWLDVSKQNVHQRLNREIRRSEEKEQLEVIVRQVREDHPEMGCKVLYKKIRPQTMGRDKFFEFYRSYGFKIRPKKSFRRTTDSSGVIRFPNLIKDRELTGINQVWVSDITYYDMDQRFYYLTFIMGQYSRKIIGYNASKSLRTEETTIPALTMALSRLKKASNQSKTIFHSDGGGQYYSKEFLALTSNTLVNSMCNNVYENPHAERINGTIKNNYLRGYNPSCFSELIKKLDKAIYMYNYEKTHSSLNDYTPVEFEKKSRLKLVTLN